MKSQAKYPYLSSPVIMGVLNITPDSFYDGGRYVDAKNYLAKVDYMLAVGASIIDIGGASSRPGSAEIRAEEEWDRIQPVIIEIRKRYPSVVLSVDTYYSDVASKAIDHGANMINDISGGTFDKNMPAVIGKHNLPYVIMHIQGRPGNMQHDPIYMDVIAEIKTFFQKQIDLFNAHGADNLILDPGFGFGKTVDHNYIILNKLEQFQHQDYPIMVGLSRKSMINKVLSIKPDNALNGTTVLNTIALLKGAKILRVHDVKEALEAVSLVEKLGSS